MKGLILPEALPLGSPLADCPDLHPKPWGVEWGVTGISQSPISRFQETNLPILNMVFPIVLISKPSISD